MSHELLESGQGDARAHHVRAEGVPEAMRIGLRDPAAGAMVTEQRAESGGGQGQPARAAFQGDEQRGRMGERPFQAQILFQDIDHFLGQRQEARLVPFAQHTHLRIRQLQVGELQREHFTGTQTILQHQPHQGEVAEGAKGAPDLSDLFGGERDDHAVGFF
jgi:hypothetical protein